MLIVALLLCSGAQAGAFAFPPPYVSRARTVSPALSAARCMADKQVELRAVPATYRALWADRVGHSVKDVAVIKEFPIPKPQGDEVLIQVAYAGVNGGCETFRSRGEHWFAGNKDAQAGFPLGAEGVGIVAQTGVEVKELATGDAVSFVGGAFAEYVVLPASRCGKVREASPGAAAARISGTTAMGAVEKMGGAKKGQVVLVTAAAGAAGSFAVQLAKQRGCDVVGTCGSDEKARLLCKLGVDTIINHRTRDVGEVLSRTYPDGVDLVVEHVGGAMFKTALEHLKPGGRLILVGYISEYPHNGGEDASGHSSSHAYDLADIFWKQKLVDVPCAGGETKQICGKLYPSMESAAEARVQVQEMLEDGKIAAVVDGRDFSGVDSVVDAVEYMLSGAALGKVVVRF
jgi:NADPH:quinone reductase-like Zn-dependent oxidoreductase